MGDYLKQFKTWAYDNDNQKIKVHYKIEHYDNQQIVKVKDVKMESEEFIKVAMAN